VLVQLVLRELLSSASQRKYRQLETLPQLDEPNEPPRKRQRSSLPVLPLHESSHSYAFPLRSWTPV
jgi:hypothetical protein